jgi:superkiller protein 3
MYNKILKTDPQNLAAHRGLGDIYYIKKDYDRALEEYGVVLQLKRDDITILNRQADLLLKKGSVTEAMGMWTNALLIEPNQKKILYKLGVAYLDNQSNEEAAKEQFEKVVLLDPKHYEAHKKLGEIYRERNDLTAAVRCLKSALKVKPADAEALKALAEILVAQGKSAKAEPVLKRAIKYNPKDPELKIALARLYYKQGKYRKAEKLFYAAYQIKRNDVDVMLALVSTYNKLNQPSKAIPILTYLIRSGHATSEVNIQLGIAYYWQGNFTKAKETLEKVLTQTSGSIDAINTLGLIYFRQKDYRKARLILRQALDADPTSADANFYMGEMAYEGHDYDLALEHYERVVAKNPNYQGLTGHLAKCYLVKEDFRNAKRYIVQGLKEDRNNPKLYFHLGKIMYLEGKYTKAVAPLKKAQSLRDTDEAAYYYVMALTKTGQGKTAVLAGKKGLKRFPRSEQIYLALSSAYLVLGKADYALLALQQIIKLNPNNQEAYKKRAEIYYAHKQDVNAAITNYKRYIALGGSINDVPRHLQIKVQ